LCVNIRIEPDWNVKDKGYFDIGRTYVLE